MSGQSSAEKRERTDGGMGRRIIVCAKEGDGRRCKEGEASGEVSELTPVEQEIADEAKRRALSVLQDALKKKDKLLMVRPEKLVMPPDWLVRLAYGDEGSGRTWMRRYAVLTEERVRHLLSVMEKIRFKKDTTEKWKEFYAYVRPKDETSTVYLCPRFWTAPKHLTKNSQPGTLIHEASHFWGSKDRGYSGDAKPLLFACDGAAIGLESVKSFEHIKQVIKNADSIEYEFEITLNHEQPYSEDLGLYPCCGETEEDSLCINSVSDGFLTCQLNERDDSVNIEENVDLVLRESDKDQREAGAAESPPTL